MSEEQEWIDKTLKATEGIKRAAAPELLFQKIQKQIIAQNGKIISLSQIRSVCAVAAMLLLINGLLCSIYLNNYNNNLSHQEMETEPPTNSLISDYNIYK